jgi:hypothetical protein
LKTPDVDKLAKQDQIDELKSLLKASVKKRFSIQMLTLKNILRCSKKGSMTRKRVLI